MKKILLIGLCCFDVVNVAPNYPLEDSDNVAVHQFIRRGGNASNSSTCLTCLLEWHKKNNVHVANDEKYSIEFFGTMGGNFNANFMLQDMAEHSIVHDKVITYPNSVPVCAVITINVQNGSRTIISRNNNLPELTYDNFKCAYGDDFTSYQWIHAELRRNVSEIKNIIQHIRSSDESGKVIVSLEIEKLHDSGDSALDEQIDYFFASKDYLQLKGASSVKQSIEVFSKLLPVRDYIINIVVPWGDTGAMAGQVKNGCIVKQYYTPCISPRKVVDTCGAGDSFIAAFIFAKQILQNTLEDATAFACKFAGAKCGTYGNEGLENFEQFL